MFIIHLFYFFKREVNLITHLPLIVFGVLNKNDLLISTPSTNRSQSIDKVVESCYNTQDGKTRKRSARDEGQGFDRNNGNKAYRGVFSFLFLIIIIILIC